MPLEDLVDRDAMVAVEFEGEPLRPSTAARPGCSCPTSTSGRARSGSPGIELLDYDHPGFWEVAGYHNHGDPFLEQRYHGD